MSLVQCSAVLMTADAIEGAATTTSGFKRFAARFLFCLTGHEPVVPAHLRARH